MSLELVSQTLSTSTGQHGLKQLHNVPGTSTDWDRQMLNISEQKGPKFDAGTVLIQLISAGARGSDSFGSHVVCKSEGL